MSGRPALLLYDGHCGFCAGSVQFVLRHESADHSLRFASLDSAAAARIRAGHPELEGIDSVIWYEPAVAGAADVVLVRSRAVLRVLHYLGGVWRGFGAIAALVPGVIRDALYDLVSRHRHRFVRSRPITAIPSPELRARFLEDDDATV